jgi:phosphatidylserine decarboxylase
MGRSSPFVAGEGLPFLAIALIATGVAWQFSTLSVAVVPAFVFLWLLLIFRDPVRKTPAVPLGVLSPVDGKVVEVALTDKGALGDEAHKVFVRVNSLGTYTARCPVEGKIMDIRTTVSETEARVRFSGLWVCTDEQENVVLQFHAHRLGLAPRAFLRFGERVGQGQRCAWLRLTRLAEVQLPINSRVLVKKGQKVSAGVDLLAKLPHP